LSERGGEAVRIRLEGLLVRAGGVEFTGELDVPLGKVSEGTRDVAGIDAAEKLAP
jgi:hypothetical protein